jgi:hypothetical protein
MHIKIDIGAVEAGMPDDICEVRGHVTPQNLHLMLVARPRKGEFAGKVVVFNLGQANVQVLDPEIRDQAEAIEAIKGIPPASVELSSLKDAEFIPPPPAEPSRIIPAGGPLPPAAR